MNTQTHTPTHLSLTGSMILEAVISGSRRDGGEGGELVPCQERRKEEGEENRGGGVGARGVGGEAGLGA